MGYKPEPIDTSQVNLGQEISELTEVLARNVHDNWAILRIAEGWHYGPQPNEKKKEHPNLVPYDQLSEFERDYDRQTAFQTIKALLAMGFTIQAPVGTGLKSNESSSSLDSELEDVLQLCRELKQADLASLQRVWQAHDPDAWAQRPESYKRFAEAILKLGEPLMAYDVVAEGIKYFPKDVRLRQLLALALARSRATASANKVLVGLYKEGNRDEETLGLLARTYKDLASEEVGIVKAGQHLCRAYEFYLLAYRTSGGYWSGINAATLALLLGKREQAIVLAHEVKELCRQKLCDIEQAKEDRYWLLSTLGEAALLLGHWTEAQDWYSQALEMGRGNWGAIQSTRHNARLLLRHMCEDTDRIERLFRIPSVVVFAGHMLDQPNRSSPRFPPQLETAVKDAIRQRLMKLNAGFGYASAACGSDILFHEVILEMKGEIHVILPYERDVFIRDNVNLIPGADWVNRCEEVFRQANEVQEASKHNQMGSDVSYEFANLLLHGLASVRAEQLETNLVPVAVWDGELPNGSAGTAATVERWREMGLQVDIINLRDILRHESPHLTCKTTACTSEVLHSSAKVPPVFVPELRALLFADVEGYSKLSEAEVPRFVEHFLGLVGKLAIESAYKPLIKNTWGDGLYFVFASVGDAGQFALQLRDAVHSTDWPAKALPALNLRIGLHAGPVYSCTDPVTGLTNYVGAQVSRAARIEPVTPSGQVYASQAFAALVAAGGVKEFRCDYVGKTAMAKKYGTFPTYVVLPAHPAVTDTVSCV